MPKGKEATVRQRKKFTTLNMVDLKSSIKKMSEFASSTTSNGDSFADDGAVATGSNNNMMKCSTDSEAPAQSAQETLKIPNFRKKVTTQSSQSSTKINIIC